LTLVDPSGREAHSPNEAAMNEPQLSATPARARRGLIKRFRKIGLREAAKQQKLLASRGTTILTREMVAGEGVIDALTSRGAGNLKIQESKTLTIWKRGGHYVTESGEIIETHVREMVTKAVAQVRRQAAGLAEVMESDTPVSGNILITVRGPESLVAQVRTIAQEFVSKMDSPRVGIGVISQYAVDRMLGGAKAIAPQLALGFAAEHDERRVTHAAEIQSSGATPTPADLDFMRREGFEYKPGPSGPAWVNHPSVLQRIDRALGALTIFLGDPMFLQHLSEPRPLPNAV
jgi:hypothetical protein